MQFEHSLSSQNLEDRRSDKRTRDFWTKMYCYPKRIVGAIRSFDKLDIEKVWGVNQMGFIYLPKIWLQKQSPRRVLWKGVPRNFAKFTGKHACNFIKKETLAQVFSCKFCEISKNTFFYRTPLVAAFLTQSNTMF